MMTPQLSFEQLASHVSPDLLRYLRRYTGEPSLAEDLLQETLIKMAQGLPHFFGRSKAKTWAFTIATRVAADYFRRPEHKLKIAEVNQAEGLADLSSPNDERFIADEMNSCVRQVIDSLPADYRAALVLHDLEDLPVRRTAEICDCSLATAMIRIHRGRARLKEALQQSCDFYRDAVAGPHSLSQSQGVQRLNQPNPLLDGNP